MAHRRSVARTRHHTAAVALDGNIYVVGGFRSRRFDPVDTVWRYDGNQWDRRAPLPAPGGALTAEVIDEKIYSVGGQRDESLRTVTVYDPDTDEWNERTPMPTARNHLASGTVSGNLYAVGGRTSFSNVLGATEVYDAASDEWTTASSMPTARGGLAGTSLNGRVFAVGSEGPDGTFENVEAYDPTTDEWEQMPPLPTPRHGLGAEALDKELYAAAGRTNPGFSFSDVLEIFSLDNSG